MATQAYEVIIRRVPGNRRTGRRDSTTYSYLVIPESRDANHVGVFKFLANDADEGTLLLQVDAACGAVASGQADN